MTDEQLDEAIGYLENAQYNLNSVRRVGIMIIPAVEEQLASVLKLLKGEGHD